MTPATTECPPTKPSLGRRFQLGVLLGGCVVLLSGCFGSTGLLEQRDLEPIGNDAYRIAVIGIRGDIVSHSEPGTFGPSTIDAAEITLRLREAERDPQVKAVVLDLDTGGGDVTATDDIYRQVMRLHAVGKPVIAVMGSVCASGGYYIATAADTILTAPSTVTGSIGVIFESPDVHGLLSTHLGIAINVIKSGTFKDIGSPTRAMTDDERKLIQIMVDQSFRQFIGVVSDRRKGHGPIPSDSAAATQQVTALADGRVMTGEQAIAAGLADQQGYLFDGIAMARSAAHITKTPRVVVYARDHGIFGFSEKAQSTNVNAGIQLNGNPLSLPVHARMEYRWASW